MRAIAFLLLPSLAFAAPVPKQSQKPNVELTLTATNALVLEVTIQNNGSEPLEWSYGETPFEQIVVELQGEKGRGYTVQQANERLGRAERRTLTVPAGKCETLALHTCHYLSEVGEPGEKVTFTARMRYDGKTIESKPLTVK
jgi:hypothetical protein